MSIYTALSGALAAEEKVNTIANNLANVNTAGFKKDSLTFREYLTELEKEDEVGIGARSSYKWDDYHSLRGIDKAFVDVDTREIDFAQGEITETGNPLDFAINGKGFFAVKMPSGIGFTRNGSFTVNSDGVLVTSEGYPVINGEGDLTSPESTTEIAITGSRIDIDSEGNIYQDGRRTDKLSPVGFEDLRGLSKAGSSIFINNDPVANPSKIEKSEIIQGSIEGSNVNAVNEMVEMIAANRAFESYQNIIKSFNEINEKSVNQVGKLIG